MRLGRLALTNSGPVGASWAIMAQAVLRKRGGEVVVHLLMEERAARALQSGELARLVRTRAALRIESLLQRAFRAHSRLQRASNNKKAAAGLPRRLFESMIMKKSVLCRPGNDLLFRVLRRSTIGAGEFKRSSSGWDRVWTPRTQSPGQQRTKRHQPFGWRQADKWSFLTVHAGHSVHNGHRTQERSSRSSD